MNFLQSFWEALESLSANKMRSGLTVLGIVIGVAAVIAMISIGRGAENTITGSIQGIGTNLVFVFSGGSEEVRNPKPITFGDAEAIGDPFQAPSVAAVAPVLQGQVRLSPLPSGNALLAISLQSSPAASTSRRTATESSSPISPGTGSTMPREDSSASAARCWRASTWMPWAW